ncbi:MAG: hypothetical protein ACRYGI_13115 [Janthinobacterium lividum]
MTNMIETGALIVGGGPAGLAPLLAASHLELLPRLLSDGLVVAESGGHVGAGGIGRYIINSDSSAVTFLSCVMDNPNPRLAAVAQHPTALAIAGCGRGAVPLALVGALMEQVGQALDTVVREAPGGSIMTRHTAMRTQRRADGRWSTSLRSTATGQETEIVSASVVLACGGHQPDLRLEDELVAERPLLPDYRSKLVQSDVALTAAGLTDIRRRLAGIARPRIAVIGGSTSAVATVRLLLESLGGQLSTGAITLMHRRTLTLFYPSADAAREEGYFSFGPDDICPVSGFLFRFGGLRFDSRALVMQLLGVGGQPAEPRVTLHRLAGDPDLDGVAFDPAESRRVLDEADVVISCLGYRPRALPILDVDGTAIRLLADQPGGALVNPQCGVVDVQGREIPGLLGIGLAAGFTPHGSMGGEPSFRGQANGLWLWQNDVGALVSRRMLARTASIRTAMVPHAATEANFKRPPVAPVTVWSSNDYHPLAVEA